MQKGNRKIFKNKVLLTALLNLRLSGYAVDTLATIFKCDKSTVRFHLKRYQIDMGIPGISEPLAEVYSFERLIAQIIPKVPKPTYKLINGERINLGKSYKEYLSP